MVVWQDSLNKQSMVLFNVTAGQGHFVLAHSTAVSPSSAPSYLRSIAIMNNKSQAAALFPSIQHIRRFFLQATSDERLWWSHKERFLAVEARFKDLNDEHRTKRLMFHTSAVSAPGHPAPTGPVIVLCWTSLGLCYAQKGWIDYGMQRHVAAEHSTELVD